MNAKLNLLIAGLLSVAAHLELNRASAQTPAADMVLIPAGSFQMGDTFRDPYSSASHPVHNVYVSTFYMDKYETTKELWGEVYKWAIKNGYNFDSTVLGKRENHPIYAVCWYDAVKWCNARSEKEGRIPAYYTSAEQTIVYRGERLVNIENDWVKWHAGYRLPTEAEWEKAARGGVEGRRFPWSDTDTITHQRANYTGDPIDNYDLSSNSGYHPTFNDGIRPYTSPVGYFALNGYGLYDMAGNVAEWCWDWYLFRPSYYSISPAVDPRGPAIGGNRIYRGGNAEWIARFCKVADRQWTWPCQSGGIGFRTVLPPMEWKQVIETQLIQPTYADGPEKLAGKDSLVVVTHGWKPNITWLEEMTTGIIGYLQASGLNNWKAHAHKWVEKATVPIKDGGPEKALSNGEEEGTTLGKYLASQRWSHIHLIGHSAGSALIQSATRAIKDQVNGSASTTVHLTFLDPFVGFLYGGRNKYGKGADWADSYFSRDAGTVLTEQILPYAHNVEVTWLDSRKKPVTVSYSTPSGDVSQTCYQTVSSHEWPHEFYQRTLSLSWQEAEGFGFSLSKEMGNWDNLALLFPVGNERPRVLGSAELSCPAAETKLTVSAIAKPNFTTTEIIKSTTGTVIIHGADFFSLTTSSPVWLAVPTTVTNRVNFVSFEASFTDTNNAEGLLSVYWNTNTIGSIDERVAVSGLREYTFTIPEPVTNGVQILGFRLDAFSATASSALITNVTLGFNGLQEPFALSVIDTRVNDSPVLQLNGPSGFNYTVESSTNLVNWETSAVLVNTNGAVRFNVPSTTNATARFYRAVVH